ncbi:MAG: hypothetical protein KatS3mg049_2654 [Caldilinea sp.]|jgi:hypothetical protein|nr:MAG: hypothetical protein KatS3mg049_2654 [Caldilinea sp.]
MQQMFIRSILKEMDRLCENYHEVVVLSYQIN